MNTLVDSFQILSQSVVTFKTVQNQIKVMFFLKFSIKQLSLQLFNKRQRCEKSEKSISEVLKSISEKVNFRKSVKIEKVNFQKSVKNRKSQFSNF